MAKIVIIEDNTLVAKLYENKLLAQGHLVRTAFDGEAGLEMIREIKPQLVLLDLIMPKMSGIEVINALRQDSELANVLIVAYSSADEQLLTDARAAGATQTFSKHEVRSKDFFQNITELLQSARNSQVDENAAPACSETANVAKTGGHKAGRVLVVEDDKIISTVVCDIIKKLGYEVVLTEDGREAYRVLATDANFVAGVFDVQVPHIKGPDLIRHMRTEKRLMRIPTMIMTAEEALKVQLDSLAAGAAIFVPKPFERSSFESLFLALVNKNATGAQPA